ncbi:hypothetical protein GCM10010992_27110 [Cloacibacterium rupense]|uniref:Secretion system C-terminal sorting domain-containing protein n=1 Tax=Cloacibacterium rupense TaxID=517423 RepID=A0ABQ2NNJ2_9FLAO|nr:hypothetical protein GCM10010992_27110 [Cloacibacterium rupense]
MGSGVSLTNEIWGSENVFYSFNSNTSSTSINTSRYIQLKVSPDAGYKIVFNQFIFNSRAQGGSQQKYQVFYSKNSDFSSATGSGERVNSTSYTTNTISLNGITVNSGESLYIRIYVYNTNNNFHIEHNNSGSVAPYITGNVSLVTPVIATATDDKVGTYKNTALLTNILDNDEYKYTSPITQINIASQPENGVATINGVGNITYTPSNNFVGYDEFYYTLTNSVGVSNTAKVTLQVIENSGTGAEQVLVRWRSNDNLPNPTNYVTGVTGVKALSSEMTVSAGSDGTNTVYFLDNLPTPQINNGSYKESNYLQFAIKAGNSNDYNALLKKFVMEYRSQGGTGNLTIRYSKDSSFSSGVYVLNNNTSYNNSWASVSLNFDPLVSFLYPGETMYVRLYAYNTNNRFMIKYKFNQEIGPAILGSVSQYYPEPCQETVVWTASGWSGVPNINKKAIIKANYSTSVNGNFEACSIEVQNGKLTVSGNNYIKINKAITLSGSASIEVESDGNLFQVNKNIVNTSPIIVKRNTNLKRLDYNYWGSPVSGQNLKSFSPNTLNNRFYTYNDASDLFVAVDPIVNSFSPGVGYAIRAANNLSTTTNTVVGQFTGVPNNGDVTVPVKKSSTGNGYNLVGNPYPSDISFEDFYSANSGVINKVAYFWTNINPNPAMQGANYPNGGYINNYAILNGSGGVPAASPACNTDATKCSKIPTDIIKVGQGFLVKAKVSGTSNLVFSNTMRKTSSNSNFFNRVAIKSSSENSVDRFWLKLSTPLQMENKILIAYKPEATNDFETDYDAPLMVVGSDSFYSILENKKLAIHGRKYPLVNDDVVPLGASFFEDGTYTISLEEKEGIFDSAQPIYLRDHFTGKITNLSQENYTFSATKGVTDQRFEIIYKNETLGTDNSSKNELLVYQTGDLIKISSPENINKVSVYDASGRLMHQWKASGKNTEMNASKLSSGLYIVNIETINATQSKKILKK